MVYDFCAKIKGVKKQDLLSEAGLEEVVEEANRKIRPMEVKFVLTSADSSGEVLVKSQCSVSSMAGMHDKELDEAVEIFIQYVDELAKAFGGEISTTDGFYNNSKVFKKLPVQDYFDNIRFRR